MTSALVSPPPAASRAPTLRGNLQWSRPHASGPLCGICLRTVVQRSPYAGSASKAELDVIPLSQPHEFESLCHYERAVRTAPVLLSPSQRYRLLTTLLAGLRTAIPQAGPAVLRLCGPDFNVQLDASLLAENVLLTEWPLEIVPALVRAGHRNVLAICQDLRADGIDLGGNSLDVFLFAPTAEAELAFREFCRHDAVLSRIRQSRLTAVEICGSSVIHHLDRESCASQGSAGPSQVSPPPTAGERGAAQPWGCS